jgi:hypothetical protein
MTVALVAPTAPFLLDAGKLTHTLARLGSVIMGRPVITEP